MDNAVALVQAYLRVNGYFTVTEFQVLAPGDRDFQTVTDVDILAVRFPRSDNAARRRRLVSTTSFGTDPELVTEGGGVDMIVGEVKEGAPKLNAAARRPDVIAAVLTRFGCCAEGEASEAVAQLSQTGQARLPNGHHIRMLVFASSARNGAKPSYSVVALGHIIGFLRAHLQDHWEVFRHAQFKDPAFGFLATLEKAARAYG